jgi:hypothetical protein
MLRFLTVRILQSIPVLLVMSIITFAIIQAPPGDYGDFIRTNMIVQGNANPEAATAAANEYRETHGLNDPLPLHSANWIWGIVSRGDFGQSYAYSKPVSEVVMQRLPATIAIALTCDLLASLFGISFGILAAVRQHIWVDTVLSFISFLGMTMPRLLLALLDFCKDIREVAEPDALLLNHANPMAMMSRVAIDHGRVNTVGLCHGVQNGHRQIARPWAWQWRKPISSVRGSTIRHGISISAIRPARWASRNFWPHSNAIRYFPNRKRCGSMC